MASIQARLAQATAKSSKDQIPPAIYPSTVVKVECDDRYKDGAYIITYELLGKKKTYTHQECFVNNLRFERTRTFYQYLDDNGIEYVEDFVGCREEVDLRWNFSHTGKRELTITDRKFFGHSVKPDDAADVDVRD